MEERDREQVRKEFEAAIRWAQSERRIVDQAPVVFDYGISATRLRLTVADLKVALGIEDEDFDG